MEIRRLGERFEALCGELFVAIGYEIETQWSPVGSRSRSADIHASRQEESLVVDTKVVPANPPSLRELRDVVARSKAILSIVDSSSTHLVVVSCIVEPAHREWLERDFKIDIWDREQIDLELRRLRGKRVRLTNRFKQFFDELAGVEEIGEAARGLSERSIQSGSVGSPGFSEPTGDYLEFGEAGLGFSEEGPLEGDALRDKLRGTRAGRDDAKAYEALVEEIVTYLFGDYLVDPRAQSRTEDGLDILDLVYRVRAGHPFWDTLTRDFRTRAIIFECKNYSDGITPSQIYSTERYVNAAALRSVCFLVSRTVPHENAELAAFGAMREGGKLFVLLHDTHLEQMLAIRQAQRQLQAKEGSPVRDFANDPSEILDQAIYDFLTRMGR